MTTMVVNITEKLMNLGFTEYESRAWVSILREHPATAYETARASGIPTAKIYPVLDRLREKEMVLEIEADGKKRYVPCDAEDFLSRHKQKSDDLYESLFLDIKKLDRVEDVSYIWNLATYGSFLERAEILVHAAEKTILLSVWKEELAPLLPLLRKKEAHGVKIAVVHFGPPEIKIGTFFEHPIADTLYAERGGRGFAVVTDSSSALMGTIASDFSAQGAWSTSSGFVVLAEDYIKHDIYIMKIVKAFDPELTRRFGAGYSLLRDIFSDKEA